jgi:rhodanese-related sulfurtransferase
MVSMADHKAKAALFEALAEAAKALGSGRRAELVDVLAQGERSVDQLAGEIQQSVANTSQHLQRLLRAGLVQCRRDGTRIYYSLAGPEVSRLWRALREVAEQHVEGLADLAERYVGDRTGLQVMTRDELRRRLRTKDVVVLDVRPEPEYASGHIAGAVSVPFDTLQARLGEIPTGTQVVAYCRGPYCVYADEAVRLLQRRGRSAARLEDGYPEWQAAGLPTR